MDSMVDARTPAVMPNTEDTLTMAKEENIRMQKMRLSHGALQPIGKEQSGSSALSFDRRNTVGDLRLAIYQVCGATVPTGAEWEPVLLNVVRPNLRDDGDRDEAGGGSEGEEGRGGFENGGPGLKREARGFAGAATLGEVREALGEPEECLLCQEHKGGGRAERGEGVGEGGGASGWRVFPPDDMQRTLKELSLKDGDALLVLEPQSLDSSMFALNGDVVTVTTPSDCRWLQCCNTLTECTCVAPVYLTVCEELSVRDAGVRLMTTLTLCPGNAPKASQLFLHFSVGTAPPAGMEMDIIVEKTCTVKECLKEMLDAVRLDGTCWHLRRLDWCEDVGEPIMDEVSGGLRNTS
ncbi:Ubiquitin carboxyl-terminal hydrolase 40 [Liparis tanakae]|uniref:Ubiquitin carboxyl-terminal hydrolase 40 n=1 Tax=Liparis tanakae TaxID=230148 RepID=A0A4Z2G6N4_9TELE|nr:Ubiquitin carboxyl-terminal hydrolase 40 [Liparis tanakae]